jgi:hypothetical protein
VTIEFDLFFTLRRGGRSLSVFPESAPMVEDIADFWCQYYMGKPLQEWLGTS